MIKDLEKSFEFLRTFTENLNRVFPDIEDYPKLMNK